MQKYDIRESYSKKSVLENVTAEQVLEFISEQAQLYNYGIYRFWESEHDTTLYDIGPTTYEVMPV